VGEIRPRPISPRSTAAIPACGCTLGALAAENAGRKGPAVQARFAEALEGMTRALGEYLARKPCARKRARAHRERALQMLSELVARWCWPAPWPPPIPPSPTRSSRHRAGSAERR